MTVIFRTIRYLKGDKRMEFDVIVVGAGLAGLVATAELVDARKRVLLDRKSVV